MKFNEFNFSPEIISAIEKHGYVDATPIQDQTIPLTMEGRDVIGQAQTGTGKTAAFGLPILDKVDASNKKIQALIISPTRELAIQTADELKKLGSDKHVDVQVVYGGSDIRRQIKDLHSNPQILVGTPGRLLDHIQRKTVDLSAIHTLVLDEADEMLNMGFLEDIESIIRQTPDDRQTLLFSATMPDAIKKIGVKFMKDPEHIQVAAKELTTDLVDQFYVNSSEGEKFDNMTRLVDVQQPELAIVFGRTKRRVDELVKGLQTRGYRASGIHGDLTQQARSRTLKQFKSGTLQVLVATDVAARGLDISGVTHVYNYDIPQDPESYVHRIGRTGRAGAHGISVTFVASDEVDYLRAIEKLTKKRMTNMKPPTLQEATIGRMQASGDKVEKILNSTNVEEVDDLAKDIASKYSAEQLAAALINSVAGVDQSQAKVEIAREKPLPRHKGGGGGYGRNRSRSSNGYRSDRPSGGRSSGGGRRSDRSGSSSRSSGNGRRGNDFDATQYGRTAVPADRRGQKRKPVTGERRAAPVKREFVIKND